MSQKMPFSIVFRLISEPEFLEMRASAPPEPRE